MGNSRKSSRWQQLYEEVSTSDWLWHRAESMNSLMSLSTLCMNLYIVVPSALPPPGPSSNNCFLPMVSIHSWPSNILTARPTPKKTTYAAIVSDSTCVQRRLRIFSSVLVGFFLNRATFSCPLPRNISSQVHNVNCSTPHPHTKGSPLFLQSRPICC